MVKFDVLGFRSLKEYKTYFFNTLLVSNKTYEYFVDWKKVRDNIRKYIKELNLLNALTKVKEAEIRSLFKEILQKYPEVIETIPILIATRLNNNKLYIFDATKETPIEFNFSKEALSDKEIEDIIDFCEKTGIIDLFKEMKDVYDYVLGVEVGIDTNSRKNRSGKIFEHLVYQKIKSIIDPNSYIIQKEDPNFTLYPTITNGRGKRHDFVIYKKEKKDVPCLIIECNFYNVSGSKPVSIAESYPKMAKVAENQGIQFIWITDGPGWEKMEETLSQAMENMNWIINYRLIERTLGYLMKTT